MSVTRQLAVPWAHPSDLYSAPGALVMKLALGEAPDRIPAVLDVRHSTHVPASATGIGAVDRVLKHFSDPVAVSRVHSSAAHLGHPGQRHTGFDGLEHAIGLSRTFRVDVDRGAPIGLMVEALRQLSVVEDVSPHYLCAVPMHAVPATELGWDAAWTPRRQIRAEEAMAYEPGDAAVIVAIVDTGVLVEHPELHDRLRRGRDTVQLQNDDLPGSLRLLGENGEEDNTEDIVGHGTSCAGIIGALGEHMPPGVASGCGLVPIRVLGAALFPGRREPVGIGAIADIDCGLKLAIDLGARVLNMSFGTPVVDVRGAETLPHADVVRYGTARGCVMVAASGNSGKEEQYSPAALEGVIAVGAATPDGQPAPFSTSGEHVTVCAPGERIVSTGLTGYSAVTGTSFASPFAAATAALLVSRAERRGYPLQGAEIREILRDSATPWPAGDQYRGHGAGILNAYAALRAVDSRINAAGNGTALRNRSAAISQGGYSHGIA